MRIAIVNARHMAAEQLRRIVLSMPGQDVVWLADSGEDGLQRCLENGPDLILMDLMLSGIDAAETTRRIMHQCPCAILVVTSSIEDHQALVFEALSAGAMDVALVPEAEHAGEDGQADAHLRKKISDIGRIVGKSVAAARPKQQGLWAGAEEYATGDSPLLVGIGASTGGPAAVVEILKALPDSFPGSVVVVLHVDEEYAPGMAEWMDSLARLPVHLARGGERPKPGEVLFAGTNAHLVLGYNQTLHYTSEPVNCPYTPSVDAFFTSLVQYWPGKAVGVLLTGMGSDGAKGLKIMREHGWHTIAQDEESSVIYGMPKAAARIGAACEILPIEFIGPALMRLAEKC